MPFIKKLLYIKIVLAFLSTFHCNKSEWAVPGPSPDVSDHTFPGPEYDFTSVGWIKPIASPVFSKKFWKLVFCTCSQAGIFLEFYFPSLEYSRKLGVLLLRLEFSGNIPFPSLEISRNSSHFQERKTAYIVIRPTVPLTTTTLPVLIVIEIGE
jgi:hypothetical protein